MSADDKAREGSIVCDVAAVKQAVTSCRTDTEGQSRGRPSLSSSLQNTYRSRSMEPSPRCLGESGT